MSGTLRLTLIFLLVISGLVLLAQGIGRLLPRVQIIPVIIYNSPTILLVDVDRHIVAARGSNPSIVFDAVISADQQRLAFSMSDGQKIHIYAGDLYDNQYHQVTNDDLGGDSPAWSPDGQQIAFVGLEPNNKRGVYTATPDSNAPIQTIVKAGTFASPAWSSDGHELAFAASRFRDLPDLFVVDSDCRLRCDRQMIQITNELVVDTIPIWSPDGTHMAFLSDRTGDYEIYLLDMKCLQDGQPTCSAQTPQRLRLRRPIVPFWILWSLDSQSIYFRGWDGRLNQPGLYQVASNCYTLAEGCQPRLVYNLVGLLSRRG